MAMPTFFIIVITISILIIEGNSFYLSKRSGVLNEREGVIDPKKRPFCNAFTGCGRKRSNLPPLPNHQHIAEESLGSLLGLNAEPAVEDLSRQIMSEAKLWEAIQEANMELMRRKQESLADSEEDISTPAKSAAGSCALPPCYI